MKWRILLLLCLLSFAWAGSLFGAERLQINTSIKPPFSTEQQDGFFDLLLKELFARIGVQLEFVRLPTERALKMANEGVSDGEVPRIAGLQNKYPNLIQVDEPVIDYNFVAFMHKPASQDMTWEKMKGMHVGLIIGWKIFERNVPQEALLTKVNSPIQLLSLLDANRIEVALYERYAGKHLIKSQHYQLEECHPPLAIRPMYLYLNKKNASLATGLAKALREMKSDGTWQRIADKTLGI